MNLRPNADRAKVAILLLYIMLALGITAAISSFMQWQLLNDFNNGVHVSDTSITANDTREMIVGLLYTVGYICTIVFFIRWFRRAYFNLHMRSKNLKYTEGWAAGAWFIPIYNWFAPYNIFKDLFNESNRILQAKGITPPASLPINLLNSYWVFWVVGNIIANVSFRMSRNEDLDSLIHATLIDLVSTLLIIVSGVLLITIIKRYDKIEPFLNDTKTDIDRIGESE